MRTLKRGGQKPFTTQAPENNLLTVLRERRQTIMAKGAHATWGEPKNVKQPLKSFSRWFAKQGLLTNI